MDGHGLSCSPLHDGATHAFATEMHHQCTNRMWISRLRCRAGAAAAEPAMELVPMASTAAAAATNYGDAPPLDPSQSFLASSCPGEVQGSRLARGHPVQAPRACAVGRFFLIRRRIAAPRSSHPHPTLVPRFQTLNLASAAPLSNLILYCRRMRCRLERCVPLQQHGRRGSSRLRAHHPRRCPQSCLYQSC